MYAERQIYAHQGCDNLETPKASLDRNIGRGFCFSCYEIYMPFLILCKYPGCRKPVALGQRYCASHLEKGNAREAKMKAERDVHRTKRTGSSAARGYGYKWQRLRARVLEAHPLCVECEKKGVVRLATDVDHIIPHKGNPFLMWDEANLQPLCHECHSRKTAREDGGFGNRC